MKKEESFCFNSGKKMEDLSLHILDIAENSVRANARNVQIKIEKNTEKDFLSLEICDDGDGMDQKTQKRALDPFFTTKRKRRFGLGLSLLAEASKTTNGCFSIESNPGKGTRVKAVFQASHIDMKPLGDIPQTFLALVIGHPDVDIQFIHKIDLTQYSFSTKELKMQLKGVPINSLEGINFIKNHMIDGIASFGGKNGKK